MKNEHNCELTPKELKNIRTALKEALANDDSWAEKDVLKSAYLKITGLSWHCGERSVKATI